MPVRFRPRASRTYVTAEIGGDQNAPKDFRLTSISLWDKNRIPEASLPKT